MRCRTSICEISLLLVPAPMPRRMRRARRSHHASSDASSPQTTAQSPLSAATYTIKRATLPCCWHADIFAIFAHDGCGARGGHSRRNGLKKGSALKPGSQITIPTLEKQPVEEKPRSTPKDADVRAIYLTGTMAGSVQGMRLFIDGTNCGNAWSST